MYFACRVLRFAAVAALAALLLPSLSFADASRIGNSFPVTAGAATGTKRTDVAYDPVNDVYLVVTGGAVFPGSISGRFVKGDGTVLGGFPFKIPETNAHAQMPRVAYSPDLGGFAVVWLDTRADQVKFLGQVWGRLVKFSGDGNPAFASGDFFIDNATGGAFPETPPAVACAGGLNECLAAWHQVGGGAEPLNDVHAIRFNASNGQLLGNELFLSNDNWWQGMPAVGYDPSSQRYLVAFSAETTVAQVWVELVQAGSGGIVAGPTALASSGGIYVPDVGVNAATHQFFVTWYDGTARAFFGQPIANDGSRPSGIVPLLVGFGGYDAFGIAYNSTTGTFLAVTHGLGREDVAFQVVSGGTPQPPFDATAGAGPKNGNFNPRVAASPQRAEWLLSTSMDFATVFSSRLGSSDRSGSEPPPPPSGPVPTTIDLSLGAAPNGSWFLAEGSANSNPNGFKTFYLIQNSNPVDITVRVYYASDMGTAYAKTYTVPANSRKTLSLIAEIGPGNWGTVFQSLTPGADIDVERSMFWGPNLEGSTDATAVNVPSGIWYFAEGSRGGELFNNYYLLFNPWQTTVQVTGTYYRPWANSQPTIVTYNIGPQQRLTIDANAIPALANTDFSATFSCATPIIAERAMYWGWAGSDNLWVGGHATMGAPTAYSQWLFAEGNAAPNFETFYLILNPNPFPIIVNASFMTEFSGLITRQYQIEAGTRATVYLNGELGNIGPTAAWFYSPGGSWFLAERSIYWGNRVEGTNTFGAMTPAREWHLPEGSTMASFYTYAMVMNPNPFPLPIDVSMYVEGVGKFTLPDRPIVPANSRMTLDMRSIMAQLDALTNFQYKISASSFATRIAVPSGFDPGIGIVVEHAMYWNFVNPQIYWRSGGASMGIPR